MSSRAALSLIATCAPAQVAPARFSIIPMALCSASYTQGPLTLDVEPHPATRPRFRIPRTDGTSMPAIGAYLYRESLRRQ